MTSSIATVFDNHPVTFVRFRGEPVVAVQEMGAALGYAPGVLGDLIRDEWSADFKEGKDYSLLTGDALAEFKAIDRPGDTRSVANRARAVLVLTESGLYAVALKTEKSLGVRLRRFLVDEVLPKLARGESFGAEPPKPVVDDTLRRATELRRIGNGLARAGDPRGAQAAFAAAGALLTGKPLATEPIPLQQPLPSAPSLASVTPIRPAKLKKTPIEQFAAEHLRSDPNGFAPCGHLRDAFLKQYPKHAFSWFDLAEEIRRLTKARRSVVRMTPERKTIRGWEGISLVP